MLSMYFQNSVVLEIKNKDEAARATQVLGTARLPDIL